MREVSEQLWRAGKYAGVGIVVLLSLPLLVPSVFVLSVILVTFVLPVLCAIAGFVYLQQHATMLYRYLPGVSRRSSGANASRRSLPPSSGSGGLTLSELLWKDEDSVDTLEGVDQEFDAVLVSPVKRDEAGERATSADNSSDSAGDDENDLPNAEDMSVLDDKHTKYDAAPGLSSEAVKSEQDKRELQFVGTVPSNSGVCNLYKDKESNIHEMDYCTDSRDVSGEKGQVTREYPGATPKGYVDKNSSRADGEHEGEHKGATEACFSEREVESDEGVGNVQERKGEKSFRNDKGIGVYEPDSAAVSECSMQDITSEDSRAVHPEVVITERDVSDLNPLGSSGAIRPESAPSDYGSSVVFRPDESASDHESFESTSDASFEAPQSRKESDFQEEDQGQHLESSRETASSDVSDDDGNESSVTDEDSYHYGVYAEAPERGDRSGVEFPLAPETVIPGEESCSMVYGLAESISGYPSTSSLESDSSEEKAGIMKGSRSALTVSEDMYDSEEQLHLQQFWRGKEFQACSPVDLAKAQSQLRFRFLQKPQMNGEERQLREELKAIKVVVGDEEGREGSLMSEIEELNQILGIELPSLSEDVPELEWARVAIEVMKVVVGME